MSETFIVKARVNTDPWLPKYTNVVFSRSKIKLIVDEMIEECSGKDYSASYNYDKHVNHIISKHWSKDISCIEPFYKALLYMLKDIPVKDPNNWHDGNIAARRVVECKIAYSTPGFVEARRYNETYG